MTLHLSFGCNVGQRDWAELDRGGYLLEFFAAFAEQMSWLGQLKWVDEVPISLERGRVESEIWTELVC